MGLIDDLPKGSRVALDSNVLIYFIEEHAQLGAVVDPAFQMIDDGECEAVVSVVSLIEVLSLPCARVRGRLPTNIGCYWLRREG